MAGESEDIMSENYAYRLMKVECTYGTQTNYLNVKRDHGIIYRCSDENGEPIACPIMNANDHIVDENITHFGRCKAPDNQVIGGKRQFHVGDILDGIGKMTGKAEGYLCEPKTDLAWKFGNEKNLIEGAPAITDQSELPCYYGGVIKITYEEGEE